MPENTDSQAAVSVPIVGIGSSAGGLQPMIDFFSAVPENSGIAYITVQHTDADAKSQLPEILARYTGMPVELVEENSVVEPNTVYVVRGHMHVSVVDDQVNLATVEREGAFDVIDFFFKSLANSRQERAIGVLLSGSGSDGAQGLLEIRQVGGLSIAQDPEEAAYGAMPQAAISTGYVDRVLPVREMPEAIIGYVEYSLKSAEMEPSNEDPTVAATVEAIVDYLNREHDSDFRCYKRSTITRRIQRRKGICQIESIQDYYRYMQENEDEAQQLVRDMLVGVTSFFRDPEAFEELREKVIVPLVESKDADEPIRIWVPGAATGEEAYSIAMLVWDVMIELDKKLPLKIFATDLNSEAVSIARYATYPESIRSDVRDEYLKRYFVRLDNAYKITDELRESIIFAVHDFLSDPPFSGLDLVSCRNVLIYMRNEAQDTALRLFAVALNTGGYLFLGRSDGILGKKSLFESLHAENARIMRRTDKPQEIGTLRAHRRMQAMGPLQPRFQRSIDEELIRINQDVLLSHFSAAVALTDASGEVLHFFGPTRKYLQHPTGHATLNIFEMAPDPLGTRLRAALRRAVEKDSSMHLDQVSLGEDRDNRTADVTVMPVERGDDRGRLVAFIFETPWRRAMALSPPDDPDDPGGSRVFEQLETDLEAARQDLQVTVRDLEQSNEDLVTANEEIMSMNEELQSANEELETSREELQSANEELTTVNQELSEKLKLLGRANADLENLLRAADIMAVFVSNDLEIRRFSPAATRLLNLITTDIGRPLSDISHNLQDLDLPVDVRHVVETGGRVEREVRDGEGNWYLMRIHPYGPEQEIEGLVITFVNVTKIKGAEQMAERRVGTLRDLARQVTETEQAERHRVAGLIHDEIQQMLAGAKMQLKLVEELVKEDEAGKAATRGVELIDDAVGVARTLTSHLSPPVLHDAGFVAALHWIAAESNRLHGLRVAVTIDNRTEPESDSLALFIVDAVRELLFNVAKHSGVDSADLRLARGENEVTIEVHDRGKGFACDDLSGQPDELGFGLQGITRRLELLGGTLEVRSTPGDGCRASVHVPVEVYDRPARGLPAMKDYHLTGRNAGGDGQAVRVLIVDDHEIMRNGLSQMLAPSSGIEIIGTAADGQEAVEMASAMEPDVILMDVGMQPMNGVDATRIITSQQPDVRVIGLSVHPEGDVSEAILAAGADAYLTKGCPVDELVNAILGDDTGEDE